MRTIFAVMVLLPIALNTARAQEPIIFGAPNQGVITAEQAYNGTAGPVAMSFTLFASIFTAVNDPMENAVNGVVQALVGYIQPQLRPLLVLAVVLGMLSVLVMPHVDGQVAGMALVRIGARGSALLALMGAGANFSNWVLAPFLSFPKDVTAALLGATGQAAINGGAPFDGVFLHVLKADFNAASAIGFTSIEGLVGGFCILMSAIFSGVFTAFMFFSWLVAWVIFYLILSTSPLFVATLLFPFSRRFFQSWLSTAVSSSMVVILIGLMLSLTLKVQQQLVGLIMSAPANANKWSMIGNAIAMCALTALGAMAAWRIDHKAAGLAGGVSQNTMYYVGRLGSSAGGAANWASNWIGSHTGGSSGALPAPAYAGASPGGGTGATAPVGRSLSGNSPWGRRP